MSTDSPIIGAEFIKSLGAMLKEEVARVIAPVTGRQEHAPASMDTVDLSPDDLKKLAKDLSNSVAEDMAKQAGIVRNAEELQHFRNQVTWKRACADSLRCQAEELRRKRTR